MAATTTGLDRWFGKTGVDYIHELERLAAMMLSEASEESSANPTIPRKVSILRREDPVGGDPIRGIAATWTTVAGLTNLTSWVWLPSAWNDSAMQQGAPSLREGERVIVIADIPAAGNGAANRVLPTDRIKYDDPTYGEQVFEVRNVEPNPGAGLVRVFVKYAREESR